MKKFIIVVCLCGLSQTSFALKTFESGNPLSAQDLNDNFSEQSSAIQQLQTSSGISSNFTRKLSGQGSVLTNSTTLTGIDTFFTAELNPGDSIKIGSDIFVVVSIASDTELTLGSPHNTGVLNADLFANADLFSIKDASGAEKFAIDPSRIHYSTRGASVRQWA